MLKKAEALALCRAEHGDPFAVLGMHEDSKGRLWVRTLQPGADSVTVVKAEDGAEVMALLRELADAGHTIIVITHDRDVAAQARRVIEISDGRVVNDSAPDGIQSRAEVPPLTPQRNTATSAISWVAEISEAARSAWRGMRMNRVRTSLTLLGIVIGVASVIVMLAIGEGARRKVVEQMGTMGTAILYMGSKPPASGGPAGQITEDDLAAMRELPAIRRVMPVIGDPVTVRYGKADKQVYVFAASEEMPLVHHWRVAQGRYFTEVEDRDLAPLVVIGHKAHQHFFPEVANPLGLQLIIGNSAFEVIGVMSERGADSGAQDYDDMVFIPYQSGRARVYQAQTQPDYVVVEASSSEQVHEAEQSIRGLLLARHGGREDFGIGNAAARIQAEAATRQSMAVMLGLIAAVSLVVGGIGVMNVMLMTVRERTREIGIRMATGARQRDILRQFLTEAVMLSVVGGLFGIALALLVGGVLVLAEVAVQFSLVAVLGAFGCALVTGVVFGFMPARKAARLDPVKALTSE